MAYDYVLAGGGSAGATLAARLSEDHKTTVCLIEAGGEGRSVVVRAPIGVAAMLPGKPKIWPSRQYRSLGSTDAEATSRAARRSADRARLTA